ncbi:unnamed protein product [Closterium sp. NIES-65]|nr:unnamed protein product [Closterium sp. NIES-65]
MSEAAPAAASDPPTSIASPASLPAEAIRPARRFSKAPDFWLLTPLLYAPLLPLRSDRLPSYVCSSSSLSPTVSHPSALPCHPSPTHAALPALSVLPVRISLRHKPQLRDRLFAAAVGGAFMHGAWLRAISLAPVFPCFASAAHASSVHLSPAPPLPLSSSQPPPTLLSWLAAIACTTRRATLKHTTDSHSCTRLWQPPLQCNHALLPPARHLPEPVLHCRLRSCDS